jgi:hypothetical protein
MAPALDGHARRGDDAETAMANVGRNEPCPCGSGKKYKRCCGAQDGVHLAPASQGPEDDLRACAHALDARVVERLTHFARREFGRDWYAREVERLDWGDTAGLEVLIVPALLYTLPYRDEHPPIAELARARGVLFDTEELAWLGAQAESWFSIFAVGKVDRAKGLALRDVLSGQERYVHERSASEVVSTHDMVLVRIVDWKGISVLSGTHPRLLPPRLGENVAAQVRKLHRKRTRPFSLELLRTPEVVRDLIDEWETEIVAAQNAPPPALCNMDGDPLLLTKDRFTVRAGARAELEKILATLPDTDLESDGKVTHIDVSRPPANPTPAMDVVSVAHGELRESEIVIETNSVKRADAIRQMIERAAGELVVHRAREHADPASQANRDAYAGRGAEPTEPAPEMVAAMRELLEKHMRAWVDAKLPALGGKTPRQAVKTAKGRKDVELLVREMDNRQGRAPAWQRVDLAWLREELGMG